MRGNWERKKMKILLFSKLKLKHIILYFKFWLLKISIRRNFNYKYFHPSFSKHPFSKIKSSIASSLSKDLFLGNKQNNYSKYYENLIFQTCKFSNFSLRRKHPFPRQDFFPGEEFLACYKLQYILERVYRWSQRLMLILTFLNTK